MITGGMLWRWLTRKETPADRRVCPTCFHARILCECELHTIILMRQYITVDRGNRNTTIIVASYGPHPAAPNPTG